MSEPVGVVEIRTPPVSVVEIVDAEVPYQVVEVTGGIRGPAGPPGPPGSGGGGGGGSYLHEQAVAGAVWTITHDLDYDPAGILVVSDDGYVLDGFGVQYLDPGVSLRLSFDISVAGAAYLS